MCTIPQAINTTDISSNRCGADQQTNRPGRSGGNSNPDGHDDDDDDDGGDDDDDDVDDDVDDDDDDDDDCQVLKFSDRVLIYLNRNRSKTTTTMETNIY